MMSKHVPRRCCGHREPAQEREHRDASPSARPGRHAGHTHVVGTKEPFVNMRGHHGTICRSSRSPLVIGDHLCLLVAIT